MDLILFSEVLRQRVVAAAVRMAQIALPLHITKMVNQEDRVAAVAQRMAAHRSIEMVMVDQEHLGKAMPVAWAKDKTM